MKTRFLLALFIGILFFQCSSDLSENSDSKITSTENSTTDLANEAAAHFAKQEITPPLNNIDVDFNSFKMDASKAKTLRLNNGTSIEIPANAFVNANGEPVTSEVNISYREFHDAASILASGIPMKASHNGEVGDMQTAGMFEINASTATDGEVNLAPEKNITVNMASNVGGDDYDFWAFDKASGNWDNKGTSTAQPNLQKEEAKKVLAANKKMVQPTPPVKFDKNKPVLNFDVNVENFPELKKMKNIFWQYIGKGENPKHQPWIYTEKWETASINPTKKANEYSLMLKNERRMFATVVCPSQNGKEFDQALANFENEMKTYKKNALTMDEKQRFMERQTDFIRSFKINNMGIYNYDILLKNDENLLFVADFDFGETVAKAYSKVNVYLITNDSRSVIAFPYADRKRFGINPNMDNQLIAILPNNKIATFSQADFDDNLDQMKASKGASFTFKMTVKDAPIKNMEDLEKAVAAL